MTPSYNQGRFIEETIRSVLLQGYPNLEYIVIDGGSTDCTLEVLETYTDWIDFWVSEPDEGQSNAINKGMQRATGRIGAWLNSDDLYPPGALHAVGQYFLRHPDCRWLGGAARFEYEDDRPDRQSPAGLVSPDALIEFWRLGEPGRAMKQPSHFWEMSLWREVDGLDESLHLAMDHDLWLKFQERTEYHTLPDLLSIARIHDDMKSRRMKWEQIRESMRVAYAAAHRRRGNESWLTRRMLSDLPLWRLSRVRSALREGWRGGAVQHLLGLVADPFRIWSEPGRMAAMTRRKYADPAERT
ncbi:MAG: glycosyltransferase family 2 protein [Phycisphaerae bacterium]